MEGLSELLNKLTVDDITKLKVLLTYTPNETTGKTVTLRLFFEEYKNYIKTNRSENYYRSIIEALKHLENYFSLQRTMASITYKDVEGFITYLQQKVKKGYRVYFRTLKAAFNKALDWGYINENYFLKIRLPKRNKLKPKFITEAELIRIVDKIDTEVVKDVVTFAFYTGMRLNEIVNLRWENIEFDRKIIVVGSENFISKGRNQRFIPIAGNVEIILEKIRTTNRFSKKEQNCNIVAINDYDKLQYVFCKENGHKYTGDYFSKKFKKACRELDLDESIHFHTLRHSFASNLVQKNISLYVVKDLLGHSSISTTEIYSHLDVNSLRAAINVFNTPNDEQPQNLRLIKQNK